MKTVKSFIALILISNFCIGQNTASDIEELGLNGTVEKLKERTYEAIMKGSKITKGKQLYRKSDFDFDNDIKFNQIGNILERITYYSKDTIYYKSFYKYDKYDKLEISTSYHSNEYKNKIRPYSSIYMGKDNEDDYSHSQDNKTSYIYDRKKRLIRTESNNPPGTNPSQKKYKYNKKNELTSVTTYSGENYFNNRFEYKYNLNGNKNICYHYSLSTDKLWRKYTYVYDEFGNKIEQIDYDRNDSLDGNFKYYFDKNSNLIREKSFWDNGDEIIYSNINYEYELDENKNWIQMIKYEDGIPTMLTKREIEYYK
jgi:YD repeat-containing protein